MADLWQKVAENMEKERLIEALGGSKTISQPIESEIEACLLIQNGLPYHAIDFLLDSNRLSRSELIKFVPERTLARRKSDNKLNIQESDIIARIALTILFAEEVFGNIEKAHNWLRMPNKALDDHAPIELLSTNYGARIIETILGRIQHGVYS